MDLQSKKLVRATQSDCLMSSFDRFKQNGFLCDFDVEVGGKSFRVHRAVLAASSEYFEAMFSSNLKEVHDGHVNMKDVDQDGIAQCIEFMYKGKADLQMENIQHILQASHYLQMANLTEHCFQYLQTNVSSGNCLFVINLAQMYDRHDMKEQAEQVVIDNFESVISSEMFPFITKSDLLRYMRNETYQTSWEAVVTWARRKDNIDVFELVHTDKFPFKFLLQTVLEEPIVKKNKTTKNLVIIALFSDVKKLETGLGIDNCFTLKNLAETHQVNDPNAVKNVITCFLGANFERVIEKEEFLDISKDDIMALFKSLSTKYSSEAVKWEAMMKWVKHDVGNRRKTFRDLFSFLKLEHLSLEFLKETVRVEPLVKKSEKCNDMLMDEIFSRASKAVPQNPFPFYLNDYQRQTPIQNEAQNDHLIDRDPRPLPSNNDQRQTPIQDEEQMYPMDPMPLLLNDYQRQTPIQNEAQNDNLIDQVLSKPVPNSTIVQRLGGFLKDPRPLPSNNDQRQTPIQDEEQIYPIGLMPMNPPYQQQTIPLQYRGSYRSMQVGGQYGHQDPEEVFPIRETDENESSNEATSPSRDNAVTDTKPAHNIPQLIVRRRPRREVSSDIQTRYTSDTRGVNHRGRGGRYKR